jgi:hypothetical protein
MERTAVTSSNIISVGYDSLLQKLEIEFKNGAVHLYHDVEDSVHAAMLKAESIGSYFASNIRGVFKSTQVDAAAVEQDIKHDAAAAGQAVAGAETAVTTAVHGAEAELIKAIPAAEHQPLTGATIAAPAAVVDAAPAAPAAVQSL